MSDKINKYLGGLFSLKGKVVLLTGAAGGIGSEMSAGLAAAGALVCLCDINREGLKAAEAKICENADMAYSYEMDMLSLSSIRETAAAVIKEHGKVDVLINNAGINKRVGFLDADEALYDRIMGVNLKGVFFLSQEVAKHMITRKSGSIINIASYNAVMMLGGVSIYGMSKSGVAALTRSQAIELAKHGIRANAISPGHIHTPLTEPLWTDPERSQFLIDRIAMARPGIPQDLLGITILLASDASSYMSGMLYHVDGGCLAGGQPWKYDTAY